LLWVLCVVRQTYLRRGDRSSRGVQPTLVCRVWSRNFKHQAISRVWPQHQRKYVYPIAKFIYVFYVFLLLCLCILTVCLSIFIMPAGTIRLPWLRFFRAFSSAIRQMPGYKWQRRGTARTLPKLFVLFYVLFVLCRSVYCLCVNVYCTTATGWQPNCSLTNRSYHISYRYQMFRDVID
jgi:hypothetical protein